MDEVPILDRARLDLITRGNAALADDFLDGLLAESDGLIERLTALLGSDERRAVTNAAHTIKGMAMELGAMRLRATAAALEAESEPAQWPEHLERICAALGELRSYVKP